MSVVTYFAVGVIIAVYFGAQDDIQQGEWAKATALVVMCALWPMMVGLGVGIVIANVITGARRLLAKARSA